jgi:16S rRNA (adenine1518-N6/adenine1519-N6)-dimethyltransferase
MQIDENISKNIVAALLECVEKTGINNLLEIGPGGGALTKYLWENEAINFKAIELDDEKVKYLGDAFPGIAPKVITADFLNVDAPFGEKFIIAGNFPYNISTQIVFKILDWKDQVPVMIGMFQKEVAQRIAAGPGSKVYGILSVLTQAFYTVEYLFDVPPTSFNPPPKVMSGIIKMNLKNEVTEMRSQKHFFLLVKTAFNQRRKMLRNAVKNLFDETILQDPIFNKRAEQLSISDFASLTFKMK